MPLQFPAGPIPAQLPQLHDGDLGRVVREPVKTEWHDCARCREKFEFWVGMREARCPGCGMKIGDECEQNIFSQHGRGCRSARQ